MGFVPILALFVTIWLWHTDPVTAATADLGSSGHPPVNALVRQLAGGNFHDDFDGREGLVYKVKRLPSKHPDLDRFFLVADLPAGLPISIWSGHRTQTLLMPRARRLQTSSPAWRGCFNNKRS